MYSFIYLSAEKAWKFYLLKKKPKPCNNTYRLSVFELPPFYHHPSATASYRNCKSRNRLDECIHLLGKWFCNLMQYVKRKSFKDQFYSVWERQETVRTKQDTHLITAIYSNR